MTEANSGQFNLYAYLDELIEEMGLQNEDQAKLAALKEKMAETLSKALFQAASENLEPEVIDLVLEDLKDEEDPAFIIIELLQTSPGAQLGMLDALETFKTNTLEAFGQLKS